MKFIFILIFALVLNLNASAYKAFNNNDPYLGVTKEELESTKEELEFHAYLDKKDPYAKLTQKELDWGAKIYEESRKIEAKVVGRCKSKADIKRLTKLRNITRKLACKTMKQKEYVIALALYNRAFDCSWAIKQYSVDSAIDQYNQGQAYEGLKDIGMALQRYSGACDTMVRGYPYNPLTVKFLKAAIRTAKIKARKNSNFDSDVKDLTEQLNKIENHQVPDNPNHVIIDI